LHPAKWNKNYKSKLETAIQTEIVAQTITNGQKVSLFVHIRRCFFEIGNVGDGSLKIFASVEKLVCDVLSGC
jgi:hypothetical protein